MENFILIEITEEVKPTTDESIDTPTTPQKNKFINAIRTPLANLIPKRMKSGGGNDDIELGNGPNNKANLASMETLDDSLKDVDTKDTTDSAIGAEIDCKKGDDGLENVKLDNGEVNIIFFLFKIVLVGQLFVGLFFKVSFTKFYKLGEHVI